MKIAFFLLTLTLIIVSGLQASETNVSGRIYTDWNIDLSDNSDNENSFNVNRAYLTVKSKLSDKTSLRITTDIRETKGFDGYSIILKYGYIDVKPDFGRGYFKFRFGLQPTQYIDNMNKIWGRRYLSKTAGDLNKFLTTSDMGAGFMFNLDKDAKTGMIAFNIFNGTKYTDVEELNKFKDYSLFLLLNPFSSNDNLKRSRLIAQGYKGIQNETIAINVKSEAYKRDLISAGGMLGYSNKLDLGFDLNFVTLGQGFDENSGSPISDLKQSTLSFFGTVYFEGLTESDSFLKTLNLFGRYDIFDPNTNFDNDAEKLLIAGIECSPVKGFKTSVNIRSTTYEDTSQNSKTELFFNSLIKF